MVRTIVHGEILSLVCWNRSNSSKQYEVVAIPNDQKPILLTAAGTARVHLLCRILPGFCKAYCFTRQSMVANQAETEELQAMETTQDNSNSIRLHESWKRWLLPEFEKPHMRNLKSFLQQERTAKKVIFPKGADIFKAFDTTPFESVKVVILGQDPYHGPGQAHGLCFSVPDGMAHPPSLDNIFKELKSDLGCPIPKTGNLQAWADQGVLLLNATLTVERGKAGSHQRKGWEEFTDRAIEIINENRQNVVFILWGSYAQKKGALVDRKRHHVLEGPHPSPLSAYRGFFGSRPFSKTNLYLEKTGQTPINWCIPDSN